MIYLNNLLRHFLFFDPSGLPRPRLICIMSPTVSVMTLYTLSLSPFMNDASAHRSAGSTLSL
jgi:hypothetical protein